jgi:hypothetical protein
MADDKESGTEEVSIISRALSPRMRDPFMLLVVIVLLGIFFFWITGSFERYIQVMINTSASTPERTAFIDARAIAVWQAQANAAKDKRDQFEAQLKEQAERIHVQEQQAAQTSLALVQINAGIQAIAKDVSQTQTSLTNVQNNLTNVQTEVQRAHK